MRIKGEICIFAAAEVSSWPIYARVRSLPMHLLEVEALGKTNSTQSE